MRSNNVVPSWTEVAPHDDAIADDVAQKVYRRLAGEVEARNTQTRLNMTAEERRAMPATETADVPRSEQIVRFNGGTAMDEGAPRVTEAQREHVGKLQAALDEVRAKWKGEDVPPVEVVATPEQLPASAKVDNSAARTPTTSRPPASTTAARSTWWPARTHANRPPAPCVSRLYVPTMSTACAVGALQAVLFW